MKRFLGSPIFVRAPAFASIAVFFGIAGSLGAAERVQSSSLLFANEQVVENRATPPAINAATWLNSEEGLKLENLRGKVVLIDFWGTWCRPCVEKIPRVQRLADKYAKQGLVVIGVHSAHGAERCKDFVRSQGVTFPVAIDSGKTAEDFAVVAWPSMFWIDKAGRMVASYLHDLPGDDFVEDLLNR